MDSFDKTLVASILVVLAMVTIIVVISTSYYTRKHEIMLEAIKSGADPIYISVAYNLR
jgi:hypothetical protein